MVSRIDVAKRALALLLNVLARIYGLLMNLTWDSADTVAMTACKTVARKTHLGKGGAPDHQKVLNVAPGHMGGCNSYWQEPRMRPQAPRRKKLRSDFRSRTIKD